MTESRRRRWSWQIGKLFGISIRIHVTLFALLAWVAIAAPIGGARISQAFAQWLLVVAVFACIVIHELSHALVARRFGCTTREILLLPIGGIAQMERMPVRPAHELLVALAGPVTNIAIAVLLGAVIALAGWPINPEQPTLLRALVVTLFWINVTLAAFNLLPAFPMDGGRVLRSVLAARIERARATRIASGVGKVLAVLFVLAGLTIGGTMLAIIGLFVWFAAEQESAVVALTTKLANATAADAMVREPRAVDAETTVDTVADQMLTRGLREVAVTEAGQLRGFVTPTDLAPRISGQPPHGTVGSAMHRDVPVVAPTTPLHELIEPLARHGVVFVGDQHAIVGVLTADQLEIFTILHPSGFQKLIQESA